MFLYICMEFREGEILCIFCICIDFVDNGDLWNGFLLFLYKEDCIVVFEFGMR